MQYQCQTCMHVYDEDKEEKHFDELPNDWECPICGAEKEMFMVI